MLGIKDIMAMFKASKPMKGTNKALEGTKAKLFILDFDETISNTHVHQNIKQTIAENHMRKNAPFTAEEQSEAIKNYLQIDKLKNPDKMKAVITTGISNDHKFAVASSSKFPESFQLAFEMMGLKPEQIGQIEIMKRTPPGQSKNSAIKNAAESVGITNKQNIYLVDNDEKNCQKAKEAGYNTVLVPSVWKGKDTKYLDILSGLVQESAYPIPAQVHDGLSLANPPAPL